MVFEILALAAIALPALADTIVPPQEFSELEKNCIVSVGSLPGRSRKICYPAARQKLLSNTEHDERVIRINETIKKDGITLETLGELMVLEKQRCERQFVEQLLTAPIKQEKTLFHLSWADTVVFKNSVRGTEIKGPEIFLNTKPMEFGSGGVTLVLPEHNWCDSDAQKKVVADLIAATKKWEDLLKATTNARKDTKKLGEALTQMNLIFRILEPNGCPEPIAFAESQVIPSATNAKAPVKNPIPAVVAATPTSAKPTDGSELKDSPTKALELALSAMPPEIKEMIESKQTDWNYNGIKVTPFEIKTPKGTFSVADLVSQSPYQGMMTTEEFNKQQQALADKIGLTQNRYFEVVSAQMQIQNYMLVGYRETHPLPENQSWYVNPSTGDIETMTNMLGQTWDPNLKSMVCKSGPGCSGGIYGFSGSYSGGYSGGINPN